jgi:hypothetical protein
MRRIDHAPDPFVGIAGKLARHDRMAFVATVVLERKLPVAVGDTNQRHTARALNIHRTSLYLGTLVADFHGDLRAVRHCAKRSPTRTHIVEKKARMARAKVDALAEETRRADLVSGVGDRSRKAKKN